MRYLFICFALILLGCNSKEYIVEHVNNPPFKPNTAFISFEDISLAKFDSIKINYQLDTVLKDEQDELKRILLLRNWIRDKISINDFGDPYPGNDHPQGIIDAAKKGQGFHCGHYMVVQNAIMNAYGYVTRCLGSGPGVKGGADGHHGMNEIWLNQYNKWFLSDAKFNHHFEKNGVPLSALELRSEFLKNKAADVVIVKGPARTPIESDSLADKKGKFLQRDKFWFAQWYTWLEWDRVNNRFSTWPVFETSLNMYEDEYFKNNTWYWDGEPHWAYNTKQMNLVRERDAIEWTPNTLKVDVTLNKNNADILLHSITPNFKAYQVKAAADKEWKKCDSILHVKLTDDRHEFYFRSVNIADVAGPEYKVLITAR